jgi:predicted DNA-binding protein YlxM (UPF0122 family)
VKSPYQIAKELNVSPQAVYQKIDRMQETLNKYIQRRGKKMLIDEQGESLIKSSFPNNVEQVIEQLKASSLDTIEQAKLNTVEQVLNKQLNTENSFLRARVEVLEAELNTERIHSREQADKLSDLAARLADLSRNNQILLGAEQSRTRHTLLNDGEAPKQDGEYKDKKSFFKNFFVKKSKM